MEKKIKLVVVDDDQTNLNQLVYLFRMKDFDPISFDNGPEALQYLEVHPEIQFLVAHGGMGVYKGHMDGYDMATSIRKFNKDISVILFTRKIVPSSRPLIERLKAVLIELTSFDGLCEMIGSARSEKAQSVIQTIRQLKGA